MESALMSRARTAARRIATVVALTALVPPVVATVPRGPEFTIAAAPIEVVPGRPALLDLRLTNHRAVPLDVHGITLRVYEVRAQSSAEPPCTAQDFEVTQLQGGRPLLLPPLSTRSLSALGVPAPRLPRVETARRHTDQSSCRRATVTFAFSGTARPAGR
jgi:hypothetical protein